MIISGEMLDRAVPAVSASSQTDSMTNLHSQCAGEEGEDEESQRRDAESDEEPPAKRAKSDGSHLTMSSDVSVDAILAAVDYSIAPGMSDSLRCYSPLYPPQSLLRLSADDADLGVTPKEAVPCPHTSAMLHDAPHDSLKGDVPAFPFPLDIPSSNQLFRWFEPSSNPAVLSVREVDSMLNQMFRSSSGCCVQTASE
jgi:hypothetical protein